LSFSDVPRRRVHLRLTSRTSQQFAGVKNGTILDTSSIASRFPQANPTDWQIAAWGVFWAPGAPLPSTGKVDARTAASMTRKPLSISAAILAKLRNARVARLATLDVPYPHIVPVCFAYDGRVFYSAIDRKPKRVAPEKLARLQHIQVAPQVALLIDKYEEDWTQLWYILARGKAELVPESAREERADALRRLRQKYPQYAAGMLPDDAPVIRITPDRITSWGNI
jgi:PPOX class probable F420-dependent enzyme